ncbi:Recombination, repair and ssDNA binding protein UvsY [uncultured Caudovirales phage]|uniref:Recombination, repair and ssDNA binding protein UvsY n=1 Tax=uncultured Caudovirales phage TaxID=2100421 RepID=A0A6J5M2N1_9CAUD|nr:Recombination, repair and ssDNA binding protein UvsY [uncultured Caudovirales phage]
MKLEEIEALWEQDSKIDRTELDNESLKIPTLHSKYYKIFLREKVQLKSEEQDYKLFYKLKHEYYTGKLSQEELSEYNWQPFQFVLKGDLQIYIDSDKELSSRLLKLQVQREKVEFLENIIKTLNSRGFLIKNAIDFIRFTSGG